jgi:hypothetical protein
MEWMSTKDRLKKEISYLKHTIELDQHQVPILFLLFISLYINFLSLDRIFK